MKKVRPFGQWFEEECIDNALDLYVSSPLLWSIRSLSISTIFVGLPMSSVFAIAHFLLFKDLLCCLIFPVGLALISSLLYFLALGCTVVKGVCDE